MGAGYGFRKGEASASDLVTAEALGQWKGNILTVAVAESKELEE